MKSLTRDLIYGGLVVIGTICFINLASLGNDFKSSPVKPVPPPFVDTRFISAVEVVLEHEGGFSNDKADPGGATNHGISLRFLRSTGIDINGDGRTDEDDIRILDRQSAVNMYRKFWWDKYHYDNFNALHLATKVFDLSVNMGAVPAHKILQRAMNNLYPNGVIVNGQLGLNVFNIANKLESTSLHKQIRIEAKKYYLSLIEKNKIFIKFKNGWLTRASW